MITSLAASRRPEIRTDSSVPRLELRGVSKSVNGNHIVDRIDLTIMAGECIVLLGSSGCGKTTTLRMIAGFDQPTGGEIYLGGRIVSSADVMVPTERRQLGMVFQNYAVWPHKNVAENIVYGLVVARVPRAQIREALDRTLQIVRLEGLADRYPSELSGGQQQRVALARAIATEPSLLLLDEPLSNLDASLRHKMRMELKDLHRRIRTTMLFVTHDQEEALVLADRVVVINNGKVEQIGAPEDIYRRPHTRFVASFVGISNLLSGTVVAKEVAGKRILLRTTSGARLWGRTDTDTFASLSEGTTAALVVRPEDICVGPPGRPGETSMAARVKDAVFLGNHYELRLDVGGEIYHAQTRSLADVSGDATTITIDESASWIVP